MKDLEFAYKVTCSNCGDTQYYDKCTDFSRTNCWKCDSIAFGLRRETRVKWERFPEGECLVEGTW